MVTKHYQEDPQLNWQGEGAVNASREINEDDDKEQTE